MSAAENLEWIEVGGYVKQRVVENAEGRKAAYERFLESQKHSQVDPWEERSREEAHPEFTPLKEVG